MKEKAFCLRNVKAEEWSFKLIPNLSTFETSSQGLRLVLKVFGSGKAVKLFAAFYCSFCRSLSPTVAFIVAYDENLKRYDCCLWTKGREGKTSRGLKLFSRF